MLIGLKVMSGNLQTFGAERTVIADIMTRTTTLIPFRVVFRLGWLTDMPDQQIFVGIDAPFPGSQLA